MEFDGSNWTTEKIIEKIANRRIRSLVLADTSADDNLLIELAGRGDLTSLDITSDLITDAGVSAIAKHCQMESLMLHNAPGVTDKSMPFISTCATLRELYIANTRITDRGIGAVSELPELWSLVVSNTEISDAGIKAIASQSIDLISFEDCDVTGSGFESWSVNKKMSFYGEGSNLNDEGFSAACASLTFMWNVVISDTNIGDEGVMALAGRGPTMIRLRGSKVTYRGIEWLVNNTPVQSIEADSKQLSASQAKSLERQRRHLWISVD